MTFTLIRNGTLIDGNGGPPVADAAVLVADDRIVAVGRDALSMPAGKIADLDAQGGFILPGFIDCHVHVVLGDLTIPRLLSTPLSLTLFNSMTHLRRTLDAGVTSVRDAGGADLGLKQAVDSGLVAGPRLQISISILSITGGHLDYLMPSGNGYSLFPAYPGRPDGVCDGVEEVRRKVREVLRAGADIVKICTTGGTMSPNDQPTDTQFSPEELAVIVQEAAYRGGKKVMSHSQGALGIKNAVRAGVHSIEHGVYVDDEAIDLMLERGTYLVPTLLPPVYVLEKHAEMKDLPEWGIRKMEGVLEAAIQNISKAHKAGVRIAMGTDACVGPHGANLRELGLMCRVGMSPMESIVAATKTAAGCLGWADRVGTVEVGKLADIVISKTDPLANIDSLAENDNIIVVLKDGRIVKDLRVKAQGSE